ncbi:YrvL family regulatory protein [Planococcus beigongshangi]|uniref:YrvL family regulatory protein n=1 Tax=Planococcus beigongshangi TaxID=2782536 RepID=UPI00193B6B43|nr:YrvL family regulatory protein [Planococcus beigongshangi]
MFKQLFSLFPILLIFAILFLPLILIDVFIIHFMGGSYSTLSYLVLFLIIFYIADLLLNIIIDSLLKVTSDFSFLKTNSHLISAVFDLIGSFIVISVLDSLFQSITLSIVIKLLIVFLHTSLVYLFHKGQTENDGQDAADTMDNKLPATVEYEISYLLQKENLVTCIDLIKQKYPDIPKAAIIQAVRKINSENK